MTTGAEANPRIVEYRLIKGDDVDDLNTLVNALMDDYSTPHSVWRPHEQPFVLNNKPVQLMYLLRATRPNKLTR